MSKVIMSVEIKGGIQEMTLYIHLILYPLWVGMFQVCPGWQSVPEMLYAMCNWAAIGEVNSDDKHYNCDHHYLIYHSSLLQDEYKEGRAMPGDDHVARLPGEVQLVSMIGNWKGYVLC